MLPTILAALLLVLPAIAGAQSAFTPGADEPKAATGPTTTTSLAVPPSSTTSLPAPATSTTSTSSSTSSSSTSSTLPGSVVSCGNPTASAPPGTVGYWGGARSASQSCVVAAAGTPTGVRLYLGSLAATGETFALRVSVYRLNTDGTLTRLCESGRITSATPNAFLTVPLAGCGAVAAGTPLLPAWITDSNTTQIGELAGCSLANGATGTNRWQNGGTTGQAFPAAWNPTAPDGCRSAVSVLVTTAGPTTTVPPPTSTTSSSSSSTSKTSTTSITSSTVPPSSTTTSSTTSTSVMCCKPSTEPCP